MNGWTTARLSLTPRLPLSDRLRSLSHIRRHPSIRTPGATLRVRRPTTDGHAARCLWLTATIGTSSLGLSRRRKEAARAAISGTLDARAIIRILYSVRWPDWKRGRVGQTRPCSACPSAQR
ncbi:hypothetical protein BD310DRAFT_941630, partial [Dichomitus squalens]